MGGVRAGFLGMSTPRLVPSVFFPDAWVPQDLGLRSGPL